LAKRPIYLTATYLVIAWALMVSYQIFTQTAVKTLASALNGPAPLIATWLNSSSAVATFICGFAWMFVLSAFAQSLMFGRERRLSIQFLISLALTTAGSAVLTLLGASEIDLAAVLSEPFTAIFENAAFASFYLALPFIFMIIMDCRYIQKHR